MTRVESISMEPLLVLFASLALVIKVLLGLRRAFNPRLSSARDEPRIISRTVVVKIKKLLGNRMS